MLSLRDLTEVYVAQTLLRITLPRTNHFNFKKSCKLLHFVEGFKSFFPQSFAEVLTGPAKSDTTGNVFFGVVLKNGSRGPHCNVLDFFLQERTFSFDCLASVLLF